MLKEELEQIFTPDEIAVLVKKLSEPTNNKVLANQEEIDVWCKFVRYHHNRFMPEYASRELFESMFELSTNKSVVYEIWEDMIG